MHVHLDVWSDYVCPFCYLEVPVLDRVTASYGDQVSIQWRAYELRPEPVATLNPQGRYLRETWERAVFPMAADRRLKLRLPPVQPRSRLAHEAARFAGQCGQFAAMNLALFKAFFEQGKDIGKPQVLIDIGKSVGLDPEALRHVLDEGWYRPQVQADQDLATKLNLSGVPGMFAYVEGASLDQAVEICGAQSYERVASILDRLLGRPPGAAKAAPSGPLSADMRNRLLLQCALG